MSKLILDDYKECKANCKCFRVSRFGVYDMRKTYGICSACRKFYHKILVNTLLVQTEDIINDTTNGKITTEGGN